MERKLMVREKRINENWKEIDDVVKELLDEIDFHYEFDHKLDNEYEPIVFLGGDEYEYSYAFKELDGEGYEMEYAKFLREEMYDELYERFMNRCECVEGSIYEYKEIYTINGQTSKQVFFSDETDAKAFKEKIGGDYVNFMDLVEVELKGGEMVDMWIVDYIIEESEDEELVNWSYK